MENITLQTWLQGGLFIICWCVIVGYLASKLFADMPKDNQ